MYKSLNGLVERDMNFIRQQEQLDYNTRTKLNFRLPSVKRNRNRILTPLARQSDNP